MVKLVFTCSPLPTVTAPTVMPGADTVIARVAAFVEMKPGMAAVTLVEPDWSGWNATPPEVVSVGEFDWPAGIVAVCDTPGDAPFLRSSLTPSGGIVRVTVNGPGAPARTACSWFSPEFTELAIPVRAYTKLDGESVVVGVDVPWRSIAACWEVMI